MLAESAHDRHGRLDQILQPDKGGAGRLEVGPIGAVVCVPHGGQVVVAPAVEVDRASEPLGERRGTVVEPDLVALPSRREQPEVRGTNHAHHEGGTQQLFGRAPISLLPQAAVVPRVERR